MPYRYAHYFCLLLIPAAVIAFSGYLSELPDAGLAKHAHAIAATLWILLLAGQSASIHSGRRSIHKFLGSASLLIFPLYISGFFLVYRSEARRISASDAYAEVFGPGIGAITLVAVVASAYMFYSGLRDRRNVQLHARWMLVTVFLFAESVLGRILNNFIPALYVNDVTDVRRIYDAFHLSQLFAVLLALVLYFRDREHGAPFLFVIVALLVQSLSLELFDGFGPWRDMFLTSGDWPIGAFAVIGIALGAVVAGLGWSAGKHNPRQAR
ncbi:MAG: hypothetical protein AAF290_16925 [Pseudomonadota bacterium]